MSPLKKGSTGFEVKVLQSQLAKRGFLKLRAGPTGYYGDSTTAAVLAFQKDENAQGHMPPLPETGEACEATLIRLAQASSTRPDPLRPGPTVVTARYYRRANRERVGSIVLHATQSPIGSAQSVATMFATLPANLPSNKQRSSHFVIDDKRTFLCVPEGDIAFAAPKMNRVGIQIEMTGYSEWEQEWMLERQQRMILNVTLLCVELCLRWNIRPVFLGVNELSALAPKILAGADLEPEESGITTHAVVTKAFKLMGGHWDPGPHFPVASLVENVAARIG